VWHNGSGTLSGTEVPSTEQRTAFGAGLAVIMEPFHDQTDITLNFACPFLPRTRNSGSIPTVKCKASSPAFFMQRTFNDPFKEILISLEVYR
jgi:hypothetical protein